MSLHIPTRPEPSYQQPSSAELKQPYRARPSSQSLQVTPESVSPTSPSFVEPVLVPSPPKQWSTKKRLVISAIKLAISITAVAASLVGLVVVSLRAAKTATEDSTDAKTPPSFASALYLIGFFMISLIITLIILFRAIRTFYFATCLHHPPPQSPLHRFLQFIFGPPPTVPPSPTLPTYRTALAQAGRRMWFTRHRAAEDLGDEDLEVIRIQKLGGAPPAWDSNSLRNSRILLANPLPVPTRPEEVERTVSGGSEASWASAGVKEFIRRLSRGIYITPPQSPFVAQMEQIREEKRASGEKFEV